MYLWSPQSSLLSYSTAAFLTECIFWGRNPQCWAFLRLCNSYIVSGTHNSSFRLLLWNQFIWMQRVLKLGGGCSFHQVRWGHVIYNWDFCQCGEVALFLTDPATAVLLMASKNFDRLRTTQRRPEVKGKEAMRLFTFYVLLFEPRATGRYFYRSSKNDF